MNLRDKAMNDRRNLETYEFHSLHSLSNILVTLRQNWTEAHAERQSKRDPRNTKHPVTNGPEKHIKHQ
jgi:hypothetical protein